MHNPKISVRALSLSLFLGSKQAIGSISWVVGSDHTWLHSREWRFEKDLEWGRRFTERRRRVWQRGQQRYKGGHGQRSPTLPATTLYFCSAFPWSWLLALHLRQMPPMTHLTPVLAGVCSLNKNWRNWTHVNRILFLHWLITVSLQIDIQCAI